MEIAKTDLKTALEAAVEALRDRARHAEEDLVERVDEFLEHLNAAREEAEGGLGPTLEAQFVVPFDTDSPVLMVTPMLNFPADGRSIYLEPDLTGPRYSQAPTLPPGRYRISVAITRVADPGETGVSDMARAWAAPGAVLPVCPTSAAGVECAECPEGVESGSGDCTPAQSGGSDLPKDD